ncbi:MAG TPA: hypothetical protein VGO70_10300 [Arsenicitalea sp.]|jgi:hypothetical protein|nr:hypothetical protein [Arsenicitalea sp.]
MLEKCQAYLVGKNPFQVAALRSLVQSVGFSSSIDAATGEGTTNPGARIKFFFIDYRVDDEEIISTMAAVRASSDQDLRFSAFVLVVDDLLAGALPDNVDFGFDVVITVPEEAEVTRARLLGQLFLEQTYFETANYLGPDRRRVEFRPDIGERRQPGPGKHIRYLFKRDPDTGIKIVERVLAA